MATLNEKIRQIISTYGLSDRQFALKIGVAQSVIGSMFQKGTEPSSKVIRSTLAAFPDVSSDWFIRDSGSMLLSQSAESARVNGLVDAIATLQQTINAQAETISALNARIKELENQLK